MGYSDRRILGDKFGGEGIRVLVWGSLGFRMFVLRGFWEGDYWVIVGFGGFREMVRFGYVVR